MKRNKVQIHTEKTNEVKKLVVSMKVRFSVSNIVIQKTEKEMGKSRLGIKKLILIKSQNMTIVSKL
jgi:hypothetical protein